MECVGNAAKLYRVNLTEAEREHLSGITRRGKSSGRKVKWALICVKPMPALPTSRWRKP